MTRRLIGLMRKEFIQFLRDRALVLLILYTFVEIAICGWALTLEVRDMPAVIYDGDRSSQSRELARAFARLENFDVIAWIADPAEIDSLMDAGKASLALVIPQEFSRNIQAGVPTQVQLIVDGSNSSLAGQAMAITSDLVRAYNAEVALDLPTGASLRQSALLPAVNNLLRIWYMPQLEYVHFIMLTMLTISVLMLGILLPAASIVREKEAGTFEQLMVTPIRGLELIIAKTVPMVLLKLVGLTLGVGMSLWLFNVPLRGSLGLFYGISLLMFMSSMGIGVLIGTFAQNMQQTLLIAFFILFPVAFLSGTMVPISNMPLALQWLTYLSPLRYYVDITLGIFLKGVGLEALWGQTLALAIFGTVLLGLGTLRLRHSLA
ncbi:MAG TPA: ABC transporter permease [Anaerolineales bacterium]|jgi:ABC-2 type transport system permease protein|nr:ABC transporter permease [Anaerolineales bacterium]